MSRSGQTAAVDAGCDRTDPRRLAGKEISTVPSGCVVTVGATVAPCPPTR